MNKKIYHLISILIFIPTIVWLISGCFIVASVYDGEVYGQEFNAEIIIFISSLCAMVIIFSLLKLTNLGKNYWKDNVKRDKARKRNKSKSRVINELKDRDYSNLKKYNDCEVFKVEKNSFIIVFYVLSACWVVLLIICYILFGFSLIQEGLGAVYIGILVWLCLFIEFIIKGVYTKIRIDNSGVHLMKGKTEKSFLAWEDIQGVGISKNLLGNGFMFSYLYFTKKKIKKTIYIGKYEEKKDIIMLRYRPSLVHCILNYWKDEVKGLDSQKDWLRYINKL